MSLRLLLLLGLAVPGVELLSIAVMVSAIGWLATIGLLILGMVVGYGLLRSSGREVLAALRKTGGVDGLRIERSLGLSRSLAAGVLFIVPGFLSDVLALLLLVSGKRQITFFQRSTVDRRTIELDQSAYRNLDDNRR